jgi:hypothetical protein
MPQEPIVGCGRFLTAPSFVGWVERRRAPLFFTNPLHLATHRLFPHHACQTTPFSPAPLLRRPSHYSLLGIWVSLWAVIIIK